MRDGQSPVTQAPGKAAKRSGRLIGGFEYQHHVAAWYATELLGPSGHLIETIVESDDRTAIDDVIQRHAGAKTEFVQVKWGADSPARAVGIGDLTAGGDRSLIAKLAHGWKAKSEPLSIVLWTNRPADTELAELLEGSRFRMPDELDANARRSYSAVAGASGLSSEEAQSFLAAVEVRFSGPSQDELRAWISRRLRDYGLPDDEGRLLDRLLALIRDAAVYGRTPLTRAILSSALGLGPQRELSEDLRPPEFGFIERPALERALVDRIRRSNEGFVVVLGQPGAGKTAFLRAAIEERPPADFVVVARHWTYLPQGSYGRERAEETAVLETFMAQIQRSFGREQLRVSRDGFLSEVTTIGGQLADKGQIGLVVIDALDELADYRGENVALSEALVPDVPPRGIVFVLSAQSEQQLTPRLRRHVVDPVVVGPLEPSETVALIEASGVQDVRGEAGWPKLTPDEVTELVRLSGGFPLLVILLCRRLKLTADARAALADEIAADGDIRRTFGGLWSRVSPHAQFILAALSTAEVPLDSEELRSAARLDAPAAAAAVREVRHALAGTARLVPYHRYLGRYVVSADAALAQTAALRVADVLQENPDDARTIERRWALLQVAQRGDVVVAEFTEDRVDAWLRLGVPQSVLETNANLATQITSTDEFADQFDRVAVLRARLAERLQDLPRADYLKAIAAIHGGQGLRRHLIPYDTLEADRGTASVGSILLWRAGLTEDAERLARHAVRPEERGEVFYPFDYPDALETLARRNAIRVKETVEAVTEHNLGMTSSALRSVVRGALDSSYRQELLSLADELPSRPRRRLRRAIVLALLGQELEARGLAAKWHDDLLPTDVPGDVRLFESAWDLALCPLLVMTLSAAEVERVSEHPVIAAFLRLRGVAAEVRTDKADALGLVRFLARESVPPLTGPGLAVRRLLSWATTGRPVAAEETEELARAALSVPADMGGSLTVFEGLRDMRFESPGTFARRLGEAWTRHPEEASTRFENLVALLTFAAEQREPELAQELLSLAIRATRGYGWHKDISFELVTQSLRRTLAFAPLVAGDVARWADELIPCANLLPAVTDMDEHRGTYDELIELRDFARRGIAPDIQDDHWSSSTKGTPPADPEEVLRLLYAGSIDSRTNQEANLRAWLVSADEDGCAAIADSILGRRSDRLEGYSGDRLFGEVVRREIEIGSARWRDDAVELVRLAHLEFRFYSGAWNAAMDALHALERVQDPRLPGLLREVHLRSPLNNEWSGWDVVGQRGELAAAAGRREVARRAFSVLVSDIRARFRPELMDLVVPPR